MPLPVPASVEALNTLTRVDYADHFTVATDLKASPELWARAMFGDVPNAGEQLIWRGFLGLRLRRGRSPATVAGWDVTARGPDWVRLEAQSWLLAANLIVRAPGGRVSLSTFLRYDHPLGGVVWRSLSAVHRFLAPRELRKAVDRIGG